jgi:O-antigen ligase
LLVLFASLAVGFVALEPLLAAVVIGGLLLVAGLRTRAWLVLTWIMLTGLLVLSYGFNNVPVPLGPIRVPLVDLLLIYALVASAPIWRPVLRTQLGKQLVVAGAVLIVVILFRLTMDLPEYGIVAVRDALYVVHVSAVFVGIAVARKMEIKDIERLLAIAFALTIGWALLAPFRDAIEPFSPMVGVQRPVRLFSWVGSSSLVLGTVWFFSRGGTGGTPLTIAGIVSVLVKQARSSYILLPAGILLAWTIDRMRDPLSDVGTRRLVRVAVAGLMAAGIVTLATGIEGGRAEVGFDTTLDQLGTLAGQEGIRAGSIRHRREAWADVVETVRAEPMGSIVGIGLGTDLFGGHRTRSGVLTRVPHNDPLEAWARTGAIGLAAWLAVLFVLVRGGLRNVREHPWGGWVAALHVSMLGISLVQPIFSFAYGGMVYYLLAGLALGVHPGSGIHPRGTDDLRQPALAMIPAR